MYHGEQLQYQHCIDWHILTNQRDYLQELQGHVNRVVQGEEDVNWLFHDAKSQANISKTVDASITYRKSLQHEAINIGIRRLNYMRDIFTNPNLYEDCQLKINQHNLCVQIFRAFSDVQGSMTMDMAMWVMDLYTSALLPVDTMPFHPSL